jgi:tagatose 6-phosphate kinase
VIVTVTPNPAIDVTYLIDELRYGQVHRVPNVTHRPGGKGVNVARVLRHLGEHVVTTGLSGGPGGAALAAGLVDAGITPDMVDVLPDVRRTVVVHEADGVTTSFWEPGLAPARPSAAADALSARVRDLLGDARAIVVAGSLPPGIDPDLPAHLAALAAARGLPALVDVDGPALRAAAAGGNAVLAPNLDELARLTGSPPSSTIAALHAARGLVAPAGRAPAVVLTLGADGMALLREGRTLMARPPERVSGNATGAGDAACAAIGRHLAAAGSPDAVDWHAALADAVALSAAAVLRPTAGEIDLGAYRRWCTEIVVEDL